MVQGTSTRLVARQTCRGWSQGTRPKALFQRITRKTPVFFIRCCAQHCGAVAAQRAGWQASTPSTATAILAKEQQAILRDARLAAVVVGRQRDLDVLGDAEDLGADVGEREGSSKHQVIH